MGAQGYLTLAIAVGGVTAPARASLLVNGDFNSTPARVYFDGRDPNVADDVPGWILVLGETTGGSWIDVNTGVPTDSGNVFDVDMGVGSPAGQLQTAPSSWPAVIAGTSYIATCTADNYFNATGSSFFIDWFDASGVLISSIGGSVGDPNGKNTFLPYTQTFTRSGAAPALAVSAGVRFTSGNSNYEGLTVDNFTFAAVPEPTGLALIGACGAVAMRRQRRSLISR
jgi:hypothetical protein